MSDIKQLEFVDTNVLVYAYDRSAGKKHLLASNLIKKLWQTRQGCLSVQVLQEFYVTVTRKVSQPLAWQEASEIIRNLSVWQVHSPQTDDILDAIRIQNRYGISFWDSMIVVSAVTMNCQIIWTEDLNSGQLYEQLLVQNPFCL
ncbi:PilT protein domain protein [Stanieria cyanosphaera PCC 7437]|uniref:PilT protein domain protein n=1 Tax=Stanieria cyanosphaera (strain ATCC 29371 / PCC 7437) TaxID=111780 RepID=K9XS12_STAC7|nr:PIN domain-containing protein [Stanieria cyanosphaera]AFZ34874.1 PilT protein domain protein [Stanieria cyanosphaera PCC 7437]